MNSAQTLNSVIRTVWARIFLRSQQPWKTYNGDTPMYVFQHMNATDRLEVASMCWKAGNFDLSGERYIVTCNRVVDTENAVLPGGMVS